MERLNVEDILGKDKAELYLEDLKLRQDKKIRR